MLFANIDIHSGFDDQMIKLSVMLLREEGTSLYYHIYLYYTVVGLIASLSSAHRIIYFQKLTIYSIHGILVRVFLLEMEA